MKRWFWVGALVSVAISLAAAEENFSKVVRAEDYTAAGLSKLTPQELARLDALVREYKSGALAAAQAEIATAQARAAQAEADARTAAAAATAAKARVTEVEKKSGPSLLERAKVLLKPGTRIEYSTLESRLTREFAGWQRGTVFELENGQRWRVTSDNEYVTPPMPAPRVKIEPGALGSFWLRIEGVGQRAKVESLDTK